MTTKSHDTHRYQKGQAQKQTGKGCKTRLSLTADRPLAVFALTIGFQQFGIIARILDRLDQGMRVCLAFDAGRMAGKANRDSFDACNRSQCFFNTGNTGGTGHAVNSEMNWSGHKSGASVLVV